MVGFAYSGALHSGYECILIKVYNCDDISFVNSSTSYEVYSVHRRTGKVTLEVPKGREEIFHLNLSYINEITDMLISAEYEAAYPLTLTWEITASGICVKKKTEDNLYIWHIPPLIDKSDEAYINITPLCFTNDPSPLEASFLCDILNFSMYMCGVFSTEAFINCGNNIYISSYMLSLEKKLFGSQILARFSKDIIPLKIPKCKINKKKILSSLKDTEFGTSEYGSDVSEWLSNIKRECISDMVLILKKCLNDNKSVLWLVRRMKHRLCSALDILLNMGSELLGRSSVIKSSDIKYLSFNELLCAFTFADDMRDITKTINKTKLRVKSLKKLTPPAIIYKGRFFYKEK